MWTKTQIDRLGDRLRQEKITESDLRTLDEFRRSFAEAYELVISAIRNESGLEPTGRPAKSTTSISDKLKRESIRLTQIQDIAGCRIVVAGILEQERVVGLLANLFDQAAIIDRRANPSHGYRAVHVIVTREEKLVEVQVRSAYQHVWAELSEKFSDIFDPAIKYGGGDELMRRLLLKWSDVVAREESVERTLTTAQQQLDELLAQPTRSETDEAKLRELAADLVAQQKERTDRRAVNLATMRQAIEAYPGVRGGGGVNAILN